MRSVFSASLCLCGFILFLTSAPQAQIKDFTRWVNPFIGTGAHGHTFPGATMPFGMVQLSPDTRIDNWDGSSGYHYSDDIIYGFSHTHLSGTGIPDGCDILFMPMVGEPQVKDLVSQDSVNRFASRFSHANERAEPGYYSVTLDNQVFAELTATNRVGMHRYTFPAAAKASVVVDLHWRDKEIESVLKKVSNTRIEGYRRSSSWAKDHTVYFIAEFSQPISKNSQIWSRAKNPSSIMFSPGSKEPLTLTNNEQVEARGGLGFDSLKGRPLSVKVAISFVSIEGARKNLEAELPHWDFDKVRADAKAAWNKELSKIEVSGGTADQTTNFYTALYHTMIQPNVFNDVDGRYRGHDRKIHSTTTPSAPIKNIGTATPPKQGGELKRANPQSAIRNPQSEHYTVFSLWDTFRAAHPLYTIIDQKRTVDFINTFIRQYEQGGRLPVWELWGEETDTMIGYHAVSVIADAMAKGIKGFDYEKAYAAAKHSAELDHFGLAAYKRRGYISMEDENESVSRTLEYAYNDWCIAQMARILMNENRSKARAMGIANLDTKANLSLAGDFRRYRQRARYFENLFDPQTGFFRPKKNGGFVEPFAPNEVTFGFTEGNSWQYSFFVPQDTYRLMELMGGRERFVAKLDELFTTTQKLAGREQADLTGLIGQYAHGNEPSHHIAYLYNVAGDYGKAQRTVRRIMDEFYRPTPDGLIGNEDCGQMSAWYVLSASGFYPVTPGSTTYVFGTPLFPSVTYNLENGRTFVIKAPKVSAQNIYINYARLNGQPRYESYLEHSDLMRGGVLEFEMTNLPSISFTKSPITITTEDPRNYTDTFVAVPQIEGARVFRGQTSVMLRSTTPNVAMTYTVDNGTAKTYTGAFVISETSRVEAFATNPKTGDASFKVEARFIKRPNDWTVKIISPYSTQYTGGGDDAIVDGIRGTTNFASGEWQGVQGKTYEAVIDLQRMTEIKEVGGSFLQVAGPWIWIPDRVEFEVSSDGVTFTRVAGIKPVFPQRDMRPTIKEYRQSITPTRARYVRVRAFNFGKIPSWHPGASGDPWIFVDEIFIG